MILPCSSESVRKIADYAKSEPVIIPTDTLYGLAMSMYGPVEKIFLAKHRPPEKKIPVGVASLQMMREIAVLTPLAERLVRQFMPGKLTIVMESKVPELTGPTVGVRIPDHAIPVTLAKLIGPITLTSANLSGAPSPVELNQTMDVNVKYRIDCGKLSGTPSTVISVTDGIKLIREGAIPFSAILKVAGENYGP